MEYKAYSFDLDDNLLKMPTSVYLLDKNNNKKTFSTLEFEKVRPNMEKLELKEFDDSYIDFEDDKKFFEDIENSKEAGSWRNFVKCLTKHGSIFAIITARGHSKKTLREGIEKIILKKFTEKNFRDFRNMFYLKIRKFEENEATEKLLSEYLDLCKFYPVNNSEIKKEFGWDLNTSELKAIAFENFQKYINKYVKEKFGDKIKIKIGFSDDSLSHLRSIVNSILKKHGLFFYQTKDTGKENFI